MTKITNSNQFEKLVQELEKNPALAKGFNRATIPPNFKEQWEDIATKLNDLGPPLRNGEGWQRVWRDLKCKVNRKTLPNIADRIGTASERGNAPILSPLEKQVANLLQFVKQLNKKKVSKSISIIEVGQVNVRQVAEAEFSKIQNPQIAFEDNELIGVADIKSEVIDDSTSSSINERSLDAVDGAFMQNEDSSVPTRTSSLNREHWQQQNLSEKCSKMQEHMLMQISASLTELENKITSVENNLRETSQNMNKLVQIEEKKLKIMERRQEREEVLYKADLKLKKMKLELRLAELDLLKNRK